MTESAPGPAPAPAPGPGAPALPPQPPTKRRRWARIAVPLLLLAGLIAVAVWLLRPPQEATDDAFIEGHVVLVSPRVAGQVSAVHVHDNQPVRAGDVLLELDPHDLQAALDAARAAVDEAEAARRARELAVELRRVETMAALEQARAGLEVAEAAVAEARAEVTATVSRGEGLKAALASAEAALTESQADLRAADSQRQIARSDRARIEQLAEANATTARQIEHARASEETAAAQLESAQGRVHTREAELARARAELAAAADDLTRARAQLSAREAQVEQARAALQAAQAGPQEVAAAEAELARGEADLQAARARAQRAELERSYAVVRAPSDGFVTRKSAEPGAWVVPGQSLLALVSAEVWVVANFKETQLTAMRPGQRAEVTVDTWPDHPLAAHVDSIQRGTGARFSLLPPENATGNFVKVVQRVPVKLVFEDPAGAERLLAPGMSVLARVYTAPPEQVP